MTEPKNLTCEIRIQQGGKARLEIDGLIIDGRVAVDESLVDRIRQEQDPQQAGSVLFDALLPEDQPTLEAYRKISTEFRQMGARQSVRLQVDEDVDDWVHQLPWELLFDPRRRVGLGCSQDISFLRTVDAEIAPKPPIEGLMRLLVAVAAPKDVLSHNLPALDRRFEERTLLGALRRLHDLLQCEILEPPITASRLRKRLAEGGFHALHLVAHGRKLPHEERARILLEDEARRGVWTDDRQMCEILGADPNLRLLTLLACHDGIETRADPFHGLGPVLARGGVPAVVVTRRAVTVSQAAKVTTHLYRGLALSGRIDEAINEARERLFHSRPERFTWAAPTAYLAGGDPFLWHSEEARRRQVEEDTQSLEMAQFRLEQERREQLQAWVEPPPPPAPDHRRRITVAALSVLVLVLGLGLAGALGWGPVAPWLTDADAETRDLRPRRSVDPEATRRALPRYASACDAGNAVACARLAAIYELGRGVRRDRAQAELYYRRACDRGDASSCYHLGHLLESASRSTGDPGGDVLSLYQKACDGAESRACRRLTVIRAQEDVPESVLAAAVPVDAPTPASSAVEPSTDADAPTDAAESSDTEPGETAPSSRESEAPQVLVDGRYGPAPAPGRALAERTGEGGTWIYEVGGTEGSRTLAGQARGNVYRVIRPADLLEWDVWLDFIDQQDLTFSVHVADADLGSYTSIFNRSVTVEGRGAGWYGSGAVGLPLEPGRYYLVAVSWNGEAGYAYGHDRRITFFAELTHGHVDLDPILPDVESESSDAAVYRQRLITAHGLTVDGMPLEEPEASTAALLAEDPDAVSSPDPEAPEDAPERLSLELGSGDFSAVTPTQGGARGNLARLEKNARLHGLSVWLDLPTPTRLQVGIYRSNALGGVYERVHRDSWTPASTGPGWWRSPPMEVELEAGAYYAAVVAWDTDAGYRYGVVGSQQTAFGPVLQGFTEGAVSLPASLGRPAPDRAFYHQRWHLSPAVEASSASSSASSSEVPGT